jgi:hypothetical protein
MAAKQASPTPAPPMEDTPDSDTTSDAPALATAAATAAAIEEYLPVHVLLPAIPRNLFYFAKQMLKNIVM